MKRFIGLSLLILITLLFTLATPYVPVARLLYVLVLLTIGGFLWAVVSLRWLDVRVERRTARVHVGQDLDERITIRNKSPIPKPWLEVVEVTDIPGHYTGNTIGLTGHGYRSWRATTRSAKRGMYKLGPLRITAGDPFGLFQLERFFTESEQVLVLPHVVPLQGFHLPSSNLPGTGQFRKPSQELSVHVSSVRDYTPGDSLSRIHWSSTARQNRLMVKEFDLGLTNDVTVLLDLDASVQTIGDEDSTEELAVTIAASIFRFFVRRGLSAGFAVNAQGYPFMAPGKGQIHDGKVMDLLTYVSADTAMPLQHAVTELEKKLDRNTTLVIVTPSADLTWIELAGSMARRGIGIVAVLVDGLGFGALTGIHHLVPVLRAMSITTYVVAEGDDIVTALRHPIETYTKEHIQ